MRRRILVSLLLVALLLLLLPAAAQAMSFDKAVNKLIASGWAKKMENKCVSFKTNSMGFRAGGTSADDACARWMARQMRAIGLSNVALEAVPVDEWTFKGASVTVSGLGYSNPVTYKASSFGGVIGTPAAGISGQVVYCKDVDVANGPWSGGAGAFDALGDVKGKIVLVDFESPLYWMSYQQMEAGLRGAAAVILTYNADWPGYYGQEDALGCFDCESDLSAPPMVYISKRSGDVLKEALKAGAVTATVKNNVTQRLADDGGKGYNVVGMIKGTTNKQQYVVFGGHHDAWFHGGLDNASSVVDELVIAKAMKMSHFKPKRTMVFLNTTAEEYGYTNSYYDWCIGAWTFITQTHPEWSGKIAGMLNAEILGAKGGTLWMLANPEVQPMLTQELAAATDLDLTDSSDPAAKPYILRDTWCWNDQWTFTAAGVPSVSFWSQDGDYSGNYKLTTYHTQYDTAALINWKFFRDIAKFQFRVTKRFDRGLLPYNMTARLDHLLGALEAKVAGDTSPAVKEVIEKQVDSDVWDDFSTAGGRFENACHTYDLLASLGLFNGTNLPAVNAQLMQIQKIINSNCTALDWLDYTTYPFDQVSRDIYHMRMAHEALDQATPDYDTAALEVGSVGLMWYGTQFSHEVFTRELQRHRQSYYRICWGGQGHLAKYQDLTEELFYISHSDAASAMDSLSAKIKYQSNDLTDRIVTLTDALNGASEQIEDLYGVVALP